MARNTGEQLNNKWQVGAQHALYRRDGTWYHLLERFPAALFDEDGYILKAYTVASGAINIL